MDTLFDTVQTLNIAHKHMKMSYNRFSNHFIIVRCSTKFRRLEKFITDEATYFIMVNVVDKSFFALSSLKYSAGVKEQGLILFTAPHS